MQAHAAMRGALDNILLNEGSQSHRTTSSVRLSGDVSRTGSSLEAGIKSVVAEGCGAGRDGG